MKKDMLKELREIVKTPEGECMILPFGNANPYDVIEWITNLSDEDFSDLMKIPIIVQAKIHYTKIRTANRVNN